MKKTLALVLAVLMLVSVCAFGASAEAGKKKESVFEAPYGTPTIDGTIDAIWSKATPQSFDQTVVQWDYDGANHYKKVNMTDAIVSGAIRDKAQFRAMWDENYIYFLVEVKDTTMPSQCPATGNWHRQDAVGYSIGKDWNNASAGNTERSYCHLWAWDGISANHTGDNADVWVQQSDTEKNFKVVHTTGGYLIESKVKTSASKNGINSLELKAGSTIPFDLWVNESLNTDGSPARQFIYTWADPEGTTSNNNQAKGTLKLVYAKGDASNYLKETLPSGKKDIVAGIAPTLRCKAGTTGGDNKATPDQGENNGIKLPLLTDGIIAAKTTAVDALDRIHFNVDCGTEQVVEFPGVSQKYRYAFCFDNLDNATVTGFSVVHSAQNDGDIKNGKAFNQNWAEKSFQVLVSVDSGATYSVAYVTSTGFAYDDSATCNKVSASEANGFFDYRENTFEFDKAYEHVTNIVIASPDGRKSGGWPSRISEISIFGEMATTPDPTPAPVTGDNTAIFTLFAVVAVLGSAYVVVRKVRG